MNVPPPQEYRLSTSDVGRPKARLILPGSGSAEATVEVIFQTRATRVTQALIVMGVAILIMPVVFFLPPHFLWPLVSLAAGLFFAYRFYTGEYYVVGFKGECPRCGTAIQMRHGTRIRGRHVVDCLGCHRKPELVLDDPEA